APPIYHDFIETPRQPTEHTAIVDYHEPPQWTGDGKRRDTRTECILSSTAKSYPQWAGNGRRHAAASSPQDESRPVGPPCQPAVAIARAASSSEPRASIRTSAPTSRKS